MVSEEAPLVGSPMRRWVVIAMMDIVDWTMHIRSHRAATLKRWDLLAESCIEPAIERHHGELIRTQGDSILATFPAANEAMDCVLAIQRGFATQPAGRPNLKLRAAIHAGNFALDSRQQIQGTAVNTTARLQEKAAPGGIIISATIEKRVKDRCDEAMVDLGELVLRGLKKTVRAYSLLKVPPLLLHTRGRPSIAVLPFTESDSRDGPYFGDGIVENIINALAARDGLFVVSRTSTLAFRGDDVNLRKVRKALGVQYVLSGSVRRLNDRIRIIIDLSDTESMELLWPHRIDEVESKDLFALQDRVSREIVEKIAPHLQKAERNRAARKPTERLDAYDCFLRGLDLVYKLDREQFDGAKAMFEKAIRLDPKYAAPYAYSALWHAIRIGQGWSSDEKTDRDAVKKLSDKAVTLDEIDPTSLALSGHFKSLLEKKYKSAEAKFDKALKAHPNSAIAWARSSPTFSYQGKWEQGRDRANRGLQLSPLDRHVFFTYTSLSLAEYTGGNYDEAITWGYKAREENPGFTANLRVLCAALAAAGRRDEARQMADELLLAQPNFHAKTFCEGYAYENPDQREQFLAHLRLAGLPN